MFKMKRFHSADSNSTVEIVETEARARAMMNREIESAISSFDECDYRIVKINENEIVVIFHEESAEGWLISWEVKEDLPEIVVNVSKRISSAYGEETFFELMHDQAFALGIDSERLTLNYFSDAANCQDAKNIVTMTIGSWKISTLPR